MRGGTVYTDRGERERSASERSIERSIDSTWISAACNQGKTEPDIHKVPVMCSHEWHCQSKIQEVQSSANSISPRATQSTVVKDIAGSAECIHPPKSDFARTTCHGGSIHLPHKLPSSMRFHCDRQYKQVPMPPPKDSSLHAVLHVFIHIILPSPSDECLGGQSSLY